MPIQTINDSTFKLTAKNDPKDLITVIIGDDKQEKFYPQIKLERWDNEVNFSVRLKDNIGGVVKTKGDKITYSKGNIDVEYYPYEGGHKMVWFLKEKPATNKVEFTIQSKDVVFYYQPELTQKEIDEGAERPENVVGSYAVYAETPKTNWVGGKLYRTGKVGHIYRPRLKDSNGWEVWGILHIENGIYSVEIPQDFLDKAVYPIKSNDTFGYTSVGGTEWKVKVNEMTGSLFTSPADLGDISSIKIYSHATQYVNGYLKGILVLHSNLNIVNNGIGNQVLNSYSSYGWRESVFGTTPTASPSTDYVIMLIPGTREAYTKKDTGGTLQGHIDTSNNYTSPVNPTDAVHDYNYKFSIYATYTPAGGDDYVMSVTVGAFTLTGIAAILTRALNMACSVGEFTLTGIDVALKRGYTLAAAVGEFTLTGIAAIFTKALNMGVSVGEFTLTGIATTFTKALNMAVAVGSFTLTGIAAILTRGYTIVADVGEFTLTGIATTFTRALNMAVSVGEFTLTGIDAIITSARSMAVAVGSFTLTGIDTILTKALTMAVSVGEFTLTGIATTFTKALNMAVNVGEFVLTGIDVTLTSTAGIAYEMIAGVGRFILTGIDAVLKAPIHWTNATKHDATITNATKHDVSVVNATKHDATITNQDKSNT